MLLLKDFNKGKVLKGSVVSKRGLCGFQAAMKEMDFEYTSRISDYAKNALKILLDIPFADWTGDVVYSVIEQELPNEMFENSCVKQVHIETYMRQFIRMVDFWIINNWVLLDKSVNIEVDLSDYPELEAGGKKLRIYADAVFLAEGQVRVVNFKTKSYFVKTKSAKKHKMVENSLDLFLMGLGAEAFAKQKEIKRGGVGSFIFFKGGKDKYLDVSEVFEDTPNHHFALFDFRDSQGQWDYMMAKLKDLLEDEDYSACDGSHCEECYLSDICNYQHILPLKVETNEGASPKSKASGNVKWTDEQLAFIDFEKGVCRTNAVAGSGKTTVIANRFINLLKKGYRPESFLLITFTEKGVQELKEKISYWLFEAGMNPRLIYRMRISTFNGFGYELVRQHYKRLGFTAQPILIDRIERIGLIKTLCDLSVDIPGLRYDYPYMNTFNAKGAYLQLSDLFDMIRKVPLAESDDIDTIAAICDLPIEIIKMYRKFRLHCKEYNLIDYDDQISLTCELMEHEDIVESLKLSHLIIDECQDTNEEQMFIVKRLAESSVFTSLVICGDDSQSIYGFRGADQSIILNFNEMFEGVQDLSLTNNFRSTREIAEIANGVNAFNHFRLDKEIVAHRDGAKGSVIKGGVTAVVEFIESQIEAGIALPEIAIISRRRKELIQIHQILMEKEIPSVLAVSEYLKDSPQVSRYVSLANYVLKPTSDLDLCKYLQFERYDEYELAENKAVWFEKEVKRFKAKWGSLNDEERLEYLLDLIKQGGELFSTCHKLYQYIVLLECKTYQEVAQCLQKVLLHDSDLQVSAPEGANAICLTTAHASKGREYHSVLILLDSFSSPVPAAYKDISVEKLRAKEIDLDKIKTIEEERRLWFVAITRAKEVLTLLTDKKEASTFNQELNAVMSNDVSDSEYISTLMSFLSSMKEFEQKDEGVDKKAALVSIVSE